ncbi:MAG: tRNA epoxyqueuosine(34) reductase QueG [Methylococcales bacterium]|jgi:epoxyqueuosine reductase|nr:tRNA epoxyqueuosine(34) reductase QueG [Methylococcaceae bacterium]HIL41358.1 tRNA epoxyqueuosine(34) reductase QueG [Methylococcales bacterium]
MATINRHSLTQNIKKWGVELGFQQVGISDTSLSEAEQHLDNWIKKDYHGQLHYMVKHGKKRSYPELLIPGTKRIISVRMDYLPENQKRIHTALENPENGFISRYALGRDYHKVIRNRLQKLCSRIEEEIGPFGYRAFVDSAPVLEKAIAEKAGLGWIGKHTNLINKQAGSWFFLGEIYTDLELPIDSATSSHCGDCTACIDICPTQAIIAPYQLDARRCISYLTIELDGSIPEPLRPLIGNRIYGCDDCQLICPWNRFAKTTENPDFNPRHNLNSSQLVNLFSWDEKTFLKKTEGSAIRRIGHHRWLRNIAVALGNAKPSHLVTQTLLKHCDNVSELVQEHVRWALKHQQSNRDRPIKDSAGPAQ